MCWDGQREKNAIEMSQGDGSWLNIEYNAEQRVRQVVKRYRLNTKMDREWA